MPNWLKEYHLELAEEEMEHETEMEEFFLDWEYYGFPY